MRLIFGRQGYLAQAFHAAWPESVVSMADVTVPAAVADAIAQYRPTAVLNAAGKTHGRRYANIDGCDEDARARQETSAVNVDGAACVREACARFAIPLVHLGSGCIYDGHGATPLDEATPPNPQSWYADTKARGDADVAQYPAALVIRLRMPFAADAHPRNLLTKLAQYPAVVDAPNSITDVPTLIRAVDRLLAVQAHGVFHVVQPDPVSPYALAWWLGGSPTPLTPAELNAVTRAPRSNCVLSVTKALAAGVVLPRVADLLRVYRPERAA